MAEPQAALKKPDFVKPKSTFCPKVFEENLFKLIHSIIYITSLIQIILHLRLLV